MHDLFREPLQLRFATMQTPLHLRGLLEYVWFAGMPHVSRKYHGRHASLSMMSPSIMCRTSSFPVGRHLWPSWNATSARVEFELDINDK